MAEFFRSIQWQALIRSKPLAAGLGLISHLVLNNGEWDHSSYLIGAFWIVACGALGVVEYKLDPSVHSTFGAIQIVGTAAAVYFTSLVTSILIYRAFFHRLRKFPGPFASRLSKLYSLKGVFPNYRYYESVEKLHKQYGLDIVRTGPRELSIISADAIPLIHGAMSKCRKSIFYDGSKHIEGASLQTTRSKAEHKERRKAWDRAFSAKALREYEPRVNRHSYALMNQLKEQAKKPSVRISDWVNYYSFDVMGDIGFSRSFGMLETGKEDKLIEALHKSMMPLSVLIHALWAMNVLVRTVGSLEMLQFMAWTSKVLRERKKIQPKDNDIFSWLLNPEDEDIPLHLNADCRLLIVAGSDTTSATLTWLFYELCKNPGALAKLQGIVDEIAPGKAFLDAEDLTNCPHLDGAIHEALRLHPAVPSGVARETPPEGITLPDQTYIPGETIIWMPPHTLQRDARYFPEPLKYMPERWTDEAPECIIDKRAYMPFSTGSYNCVGQKLAIMELRSVTANLVRLFDMRFAEGEDGRRVESETQDCFTLVVGSLDVELTRRDGQKD